MARNTKKGQFIVIEGTDGSGKGEQTKRLVERLKQEGTRRVVAFDFPRYNHPSSWHVSEYLNGRFGTLNEVSPRTASLFYALDRYAAAPEIRAALAAGDVAISNRYVASNLGHQGSKFSSPEERRAYFEWNYDIEYGINGIPKPDCNIILHVPAAIAQALVDQKASRQYLGKKKRDLHEMDIGHLKRTEEVYRELAELFPEDFIIIECAPGGKLLSMDKVHEKVWAKVAPLLGIERIPKISLA